MKRVWELDVLECPRCRGRMKIVAAINSPNAIQKILHSHIPTVQKRSKVIIHARGVSSAASANAAKIEHVRDWLHGLPSGDWAFEFSAC